MAMMPDGIWKEYGEPLLMDAVLSTAQRTETRLMDAIIRGPMTETVAQPRLDLTLDDITKWGPHHERAFSFRYVETVTAALPAEDWSAVRSPSRARRRLRQGHRQNIRLYLKPTAVMLDGVLYIHPALKPDLLRIVDEQIARHNARDPDAHHRR